MEVSQDSNIQYSEACGQKGVEKYVRRSQAEHLRLRLQNLLARPISGQMLKLHYFIFQ